MAKSTKSAQTLDAAVSQKVNARATVASLTKLLGEQDAKLKLARELYCAQRDEIAALKLEVSRKEQVINHYAVQLKGARSKIAALSDRAPAALVAARDGVVSPKRAAMAAARAQAMSTGTCVTVV